MQDKRGGAKAIPAKAVDQSGILPGSRVSEVPASQIWATLLVILQKSAHFTDFAMPYRKFDSGKIAYPEREKKTSAPLSAWRVLSLLCKDAIESRLFSSQGRMQTRR